MDRRRACRWLFLTCLLSCLVTASRTTPVTSVAALMLVDEGRLRVTDTVAQYIPAFKSARVLVPGTNGADPMFVPAARAITVHDLLTHTSGIAYRFAAGGRLQ